MRQQTGGGSVLDVLVYPIQLALAAFEGDELVKVASLERQWILDLKGIIFKVNVLL